MDLLGICALVGSAVVILGTIMALAIKAWDWFQGRKKHPMNRSMNIFP